MQEQAGLSETHNLDLTFSVLQDFTSCVRKLHRSLQSFCSNSVWINNCKYVIVCEPTTAIGVCEWWTHYFQYAVGCNHQALILVSEKLVWQLKSHLLLGYCIMHTSINFTYCNQFHVQTVYSVGPHIWHPKIQKDLKSVFFPGDFLQWHFPMLVMFKTCALRFFDSPPCVWRHCRRSSYR
jgi:hypothetical protein